jgi:anti-sigma B factor antagonist
MRTPRVGGTVDDRLVRSGLVEPESDSTFSCTVRQVGRTAQITVTGEVDMLTAPELERAFTRPELVFDELVLDLRGVTIFGSKGISALLKANQLCAQRGAAMSIEPSPVVTRVISVAGLTDVLAAGPSAGGNPTS